MCYWILMENGQVVAHSTVERVHPDKLGTDSFKTDCSRFDAEIRWRIGDSLKEEELDVFNDGGKPNPAWLWDEDGDADICNDEKHQLVKPEAEMPKADFWDCIQCH